MAAKKASKKKEDLDALLQEATSLLGEKEVSRKRKKGLSVWNFIGTSLLFEEIQVRVSASRKKGDEYVALQCNRRR